MQRKQESLRKRIFQKLKRVVVKIGSAVLTDEEGRLDLETFDDIARSVQHARKRGVECVIVTSGAVAAGTGVLGLKEKPKTIPQKQAAAACGQGLLMQTYESFFGRYNLRVAQILLTHEDLKDRKRYNNAKNTLFTLFKYGVIPIINENDTVAVEEIRFGDNDLLAALVTNLVEADALIMLTDTDGLFDKNPKIHGDAMLIPLIEEVTDDIEAMAEKSCSFAGTGGMLSKIQAARQVSFFGVYTLIGNGKRKGELLSILSGEDRGTLILPKKERMKSRKGWIAFSLKPVGSIVVDEGAKRAILEKGKSLLPSGIKDILGSFNTGDLVKCIDEKGGEFARGLVNYSSREILLIKGKKTSEIEKTLGYKTFDEVIHRDDLVII